MKLTPADRAVTTGCTKVESVVLHVVAEIVRLSSIERKIRLLAVTFVVLITNVGLIPVGTATAPDAEVPHTAGDAPLAQLLSVVGFTTHDDPSVQVVPLTDTEELVSPELLRVPLNPSVTSPAAGFENVTDTPFGDPLL